VQRKLTKLAIQAKEYTSNTRIGGKSLEEVNWMSDHCGTHVYECQAFAPTDVIYKPRSDLLIRCSRKQSTPLQFCSAGFHGLDTSSVYYDVEINTHAFQMFCPFVLQTFAASSAKNPQDLGIE
jgi:hypothetical protein